MTPADLRNGASSPAVAVVTRTKDRPLLLKRAMLSVLRQKRRDWMHVIVNDGGEPAPVDGLVRALEPEYDGRLVVIHNPRSLGMEAASNIGVRAVKSEFVAIHDDDDSWRPDFLSKMLAALADPAIRGARGAVSHAVRVRERIDGDDIHVLGEEPFNAWMETVDIVRLASSNTFPPIAFVFERAAFDELGGFDESLPVLGDWDFHLRFAVHADIVVVREPLARYHHRVDGGGAYGNSVIAANDRHRLYRSILQNRLVRRDLAAGRLALSQLVHLGEVRESVMWQGGAWERLEKRERAKGRPLHKRIWRAVKRVFR